MNKELNRVGSRGIVVLRFTVRASNIISTMNDAVEQEAGEEADGIGDQRQSLLERGSRRHADTSCADSDGNDHIFAFWRAPLDLSLVGNGRADCERQDNGNQDNSLERVA